eukprot:12221635-Ditylum_brightwellii.AAC.1
MLIYTKKYQRGDSINAQSERLGAKGPDFPDNINTLAAYQELVYLEQCLARQQICCCAFLVEAAVRCTGCNNILVLMIWRKG